MDPRAVSQGQLGHSLRGCQPLTCTGGGGGGRGADSADAQPERDASLLPAPGGADSADALIPSLLLDTPAECFISLKKIIKHTGFFFPLLLAKMETYPHALKKKILRALKESNP